MRHRSDTPGVNYAVLAPNLKGFQAACEADADEVAVFTAASNTFSKTNTNCTIDEGLSRISKVCEEADVSAGNREGRIRVRGYISCVLGCPFEGDVSPVVVGDIARRLWDMGCYEISLGDTIGTGTPAVSCTHAPLSLLPAFR